MKVRFFFRYFVAAQHQKSLFIYYYYYSSFGGLLILYMYLFLIYPPMISAFLKISILIVLFESCLITGLPNFGKRNRRMEPMENAQRQCDTLHNGPCQETVKFELNRIRFDFLRFKCVYDPHGYVAYEQKCDHLTARFRTIVFR